MTVASERAAGRFLLVLAVLIVVELVVWLQLDRHSFVMQWLW